MTANVASVAARASAASSFVYQLASAAHGFTLRRAATAFPERETQGTYYLWAVNVGNLTGFDTEQYQLGLPNSRQWRPGEKAFPFIPPANVLGYVQIDRRGAPDTGGWRVDISKAARWTFTGGTMSVRQRTYIEDELAAWRGGSYTIPASYDFAT